MSKEQLLADVRAIRHHLSEIFEHRSIPLELIGGNSEISNVLSSIEGIAEKMPGTGYYGPAGQVVAGHYHWCLVRGPGTESTYDSLEVLYPWFNLGDPTDLRWEQIGRKQWLRSEYVKVIGPIPFPEFKK